MIENTPPGRPPALVVELEAAVGLGREQRAQAERAAGIEPGGLKAFFDWSVVWRVVDTLERIAASARRSLRVVRTNGGDDDRYTQDLAGDLADEPVHTHTRSFEEREAGSQVHEPITEYLTTSHPLPQVGSPGARELNRFWRYIEVLIKKGQIPIAEVEAQLAIFALRLREIGQQLERRRSQSSH